MARKSFKGENPALRYISVQDTGAVQDVENMRNVHAVQDVDSMRNTESMRDVDDVQNTQYTHKTQNVDKGNIVDNTQYTDNMRSESSARKPVKRAEDGAASKETKSKRLNVLIRPSLFEDATKVAHMQRISVNELIHLAVEKYLQDAEGEITRYDAVYKK